MDTFENSFLLVHSFQKVKLKTLTKEWASTDENPCNPCKYTMSAKAVITKKKQTNAKPISATK